MSAITDWISKPEYPAAAAALEAIANHIENPTYTQLIEVLECMQDLAGEYCVFSDQSSSKTGYTIKSPKCGRDKNGVFHCVCGKCEPLSAEIGENGNNSGNSGSDSSDD